MRKFLLYIFKLFYLIFFICSTVLLFKYIYVEKTEVYLKERKFHEYKNVEIGFFGHSESRYAIDSKIVSTLINKNTENFSVDGAPIYYTSKLIDYTISKNPNIQVVINLSRSNVDFKGTLKNLFYNSSSGKERTYFFDKFSVYTLISKLEKPFYQDFLNYAFKPFKSPVINFKPPIPQQIMIDKAIRRFKQDSLSINDKWDNTDVNIDFEIDELEKIFLKYPQNKFYLITTPVHSEYKKMYNNDIRYTSVIERLIYHKNVRFLDFEDSLFENTNFRDLNHLSFIGRKRFSEILSIELNKKIKL